MPSLEECSTQLPLASVASTEVRLPDRTLSLARRIILLTSTFYWLLAVLPFWGAWHTIVVK
jgi:hypothetical protein